MPGSRPSSPKMFDAWPYREIWAVDFEFVAKDGEPIKDHALGMMTSQSHFPAGSRKSAVLGRDT